MARWRHHSKRRLDVAPVPAPPHPPTGTPACRKSGEQQWARSVPVLARQVGSWRRRRGLVVLSASAVLVIY
jgi:hypothetical protein